MIPTVLMPGFMYNLRIFVANDNLTIYLYIFLIKFCYVKSL